MENFSFLKGKMLTSVVNNNNDEIIFTLENGSKYKLFHQQQCCESVYIEDINGDLTDLIGSPILLAEESSNDMSDIADLGSYSQTWTFYRLATKKGYVDIRWVGTSNGCYSETADFEEVTSY
ncbi:DUF7448 domain-containing protein [Elizabethkingia anophelis]|uniref:DUF7448 domain-containing protein n=1 Tax=Elizabethkingia anophelis TaxID=1117645 RepID=UPI0022260CBE|nr:hypothetical protein [Elizabethkingia anophelis]MCW2463367.1 hypothetical protein [Elizabethkingia anophelis]MCW2467052.1 hypothetical protein [Elizabethkingia anophelis]MCW2470800.1 hypothetical protein [Elizabethkingia anophelis]HBI9690672.1 hypothetical protein [Elizabethkingia anophelis]HBI9694691.1 hypothetical protein [Elizabethkingia anophelis]